MRLKYSNGAIVDVAEDKADRLLQSKSWTKVAAPRKPKTEPVSGSDGDTEE